MGRRKGAAAGCPVGFMLRLGRVARRRGAVFPQEAGKGGNQGNKGNKGYRENRKIGKRKKEKVGRTAGFVPEAAFFPEGDCHVRRQGQGMLLQERKEGLMDRTAGRADAGFPVMSVLPPPSATPGCICRFSGAALARFSRFCRRPCFSGGCVPASGRGMPPVLFGTAPVRLYGTRAFPRCQPPRPCFLPAISDRRKNGYRHACTPTDFPSSTRCPRNGLREYGSSGLPCRQKPCLKSALKQALSLGPLARSQSQVCPEKIHQFRHHLRHIFRPVI